MKHILLSAMLAATTMAGELNIVHLGPPEVIQILITCDGTKQEVALGHGDTTGQFVLPEKKATIRLPGTELPELVIPASREPKIAVLSTGIKGYRWLLMEGKPTDAKWALRAVNLTGEIATLSRDEELIELKPDSPTELFVTGKSDVSVTIKGGDEFTYKGSEPCALVALIYRGQDGLQVLFVTDR